MKKTLLVFLSALLLLSSVPLSLADGEPTPIASRADFALLAEDPTGRFILTDDLDMGGEPWTPIPFSGTLDGGGHTLYNLTVNAPGAETVTTYDGNRKEYDTVLAGLFSVLDGATVRNLHVRGAYITVETEKDCFIAGLAGYAKNSLLENCTAEVYASLTLSGTNEGVGGLIGFCDESTIQSCGVECVLSFLDTNPDVDCEEFLGGVYACGSGRVLDCTVKTRGYAEIYGYAHNGGVVGMHKLRRGTKFAPRLLRTTVEAEIAFFEVAPSKRMYCEALIGEDGAKDCYMAGNTVVSFAKTGSREPMRARPEACGTPDLETAVVAPTCEAWGYSVETCRVCGNMRRFAYTAPAHSYVVAAATATCTEPGETVYTCSVCGDSYTEPLPALGHTPGEWTVNESGDVEEQRCAVCGETMDTRPIAVSETPAPTQAPAERTQSAEPTAAPTASDGADPVYAERIELSETSLVIPYGENGHITVTVYPENAADKSYTWSSTARSVAMVLEDGTVRTGTPGTATLICRSADGKASATCIVKVERTLWQNIRHYVLFGWLFGD